MTFPMAVGAAAVLFPDRPTPDAVLATMRLYRPAIFAGVPTLYAALLAHPELGKGAGSDRLRRVISAGEPLPEHIGRRWREIVGSDILDGLGSTEMLHIFLSNRPDDIRYGTTGKPVPGYGLRILDDEGGDVAVGEPGELVVRGPSAAEGYWNQRDKSRHAFRGEWTHTGDTYTSDADGYFRYCGRSDDMLKVGGIWVSPFEVEEALIGHPAVLESAVVGHPDADGLIKPRAFVVLQASAPRADPAALTEALQNHVKERIGAGENPRRSEWPAQGSSADRHRRPAARRKAGAPGPPHPAPALAACRITASAPGSSSAWQPYRRRSRRAVPGAPRSVREAGVASSGASSCPASSRDVGPSHRRRRAPRSRLPGPCRAGRGRPARFWARCRALTPRAAAARLRSPGRKR